MLHTQQKLTEISNFDFGTQTCQTQSAKNASFSNRENTISGLTLTIYFSKSLYRANREESQLVLQQNH